MGGQARTHRARRWNHARADPPGEKNAADCGPESYAFGVARAIRKALRCGTCEPDATNALAAGRGHSVGAGLGRAEQSVSEHYAGIDLSGEATASDHARASGDCLYADSGLRRVCRKR